MGAGLSPHLLFEERYERAPASPHARRDLQDRLFMADRIRESMNDTAPSTLGGANKVIEADETYVGGKAKNRAYKPEPKKHIVMTLIERGGEARSFHVKNTTAKTLRDTAVKIASRKSYLATDENPAYTKLGKEFDGHGTVNHSANEFVRLGGFVDVNSAENYFSIFKRGVIGTFHHISEQHLDRYLAEFDFRYNNRSGLGVEDNERSEKAIRARLESGCSIKNLVRPRTPKQEARTFLRWRSKLGK